MANTTIDEASLWFTERLLEDAGREPDLLILDRLREDAARIPLQQSLDAFDKPLKEQAGQFGIEFLSALVLPLVLPAVHAFLKHAAGKFFEGAASAAGKQATESLVGAVKKSFAAEAPTEVREQAFTDLRSAFAARASTLKLSKSSYEPFLLALRTKPDLLFDK